MTIDQIIERELLGGRAVALPFVGTLSVVMHSARFTAGVGSTMRPPYRQLALSEDFVADRSIISILTDYIPTLDTDAATEYYNEWVEGAAAFESGVLNIEGVCRISTSDFAFYASESFEQLLAPAAHRTINVGRMAAQVVEPMAVRSRGTNGVGGSHRRANKSSSTTTITLLFIIAAAIYVIYYLFFRGV